MADDRPIGAFDSGVGGLSIVAEVHKLLPHEDLIFLADSAHCPYGDRPVAEIRELATVAVRMLVDRGAKLVVVACNTASVAALAHLRRVYQVPFVGIVPAVKPAAERTRTKRVGVIATNTTLRGRIFDELIERFASDVVVVRQVCHGLVELAEAGISDGPEAVALLRDCLDPLIEDRIDTLVLGCTHYPFFRPLIQSILGPTIEVIDTGLPVARQVERLLEANGLRCHSAREGSLSLLTSGDADRFSRVAATLTGDDRVARHVELNV